MKLRGRTHIAALNLETLVNLYAPEKMIFSINKNLRKGILLSGNTLIDILQKRISENLVNYFPVENIENCTIQTIPHSFISSNPIYIFEVGLNQGAFKKVIFAKVIPSSENYTGGKDEYEVLKTLYGNDKLERGHFFVPRPIDYFAELNTILTEKAEGMKLGNLLVKPYSMFSFCKNTQTHELLMTRCGNCLKVIHDVNAISKTCFVPDELQNKINAHIDYLTNKKVLSRKTKERISEVVVNTLNKTRNLKFPLVRQHGDYGIGNILISGEKITVIDFTFSCEDLIYNDISHFLMDIEMFYYRHPRMLFFNFHTIGLLKRRFLEGYFANLSEIKDVDWVLIHLYKIRNVIINYQRQYNRCSQFKRFFSPFVSVIYHKLLMNEVVKLCKLL